MKQTKKQRGRGLLFANGGSCTEGTCALPHTGGHRMTVRKQRGKGCNSCSAKPPMMSLPPGIAPSQELLRGGSCGCSGAPVGRSPWRNLTGGRVVVGGIRTNGCGCTRFTVPIQQGGTCACELPSKLPLALGGYRPTKRNRKYLALWKQGRPIGFTMRSSLKAKGLIPRANGTYKVSPKYQRTQ